MLGPFLHNNGINAKKKSTTGYKKKKMPYIFLWSKSVWAFHFRSHFNTEDTFFVRSISWNFFREIEWHFWKHFGYYYQWINIGTGPSSWKRERKVLVKQNHQREVLNQFVTPSALHHNIIRGWSEKKLHLSHCQV